MRCAVAALTPSSAATMAKEPTKQSHWLVRSFSLNAGHILQFLHSFGKSKAIALYGDIVTISGESLYLNNLGTSEAPIWFRVTGQAKPNPKRRAHVAQYHALKTQSQSSSSWRRQPTATSRPDCQIGKHYWLPNLYLTQFPSESTQYSRYVFSVRTGTETCWLSHFPVP
jgi:hypothetical protein